MSENKRADFRCTPNTQLHRLIFATADEKFVFVEVLNRRDLDRAIKRLRSFKEL